MVIPLGAKCRRRTRAFGRCPIPPLMHSDMYRRAGYRVLLLDEYKTSKLCPDPECQSGNGVHGTLAPFKTRHNPNPRGRSPRLTVHGLLCCQSNHCQQACGPRGLDGRRVRVERRLFNRDRVAVHNMMAIATSYRNGQGRPARFSRRRRVFIVSELHANGSKNPGDVIALV